MICISIGCACRVSISLCSLRVGFRTTCNVCDDHACLKCTEQRVLHYLRIPRQACTTCSARDSDFEGGDGTMLLGLICTAVPYGSLTINACTRQTTNHNACARQNKYAITLRGQGNRSAWTRHNITCQCLGKANTNKHCLYTANKHCLDQSIGAWTTLNITCQYLGQASKYELAASC